MVHNLFLSQISAASDSTMIFLILFAHAFSSFVQQSFQILRSLISLCTVTRTLCAFLNSLERVLSLALAQSPPMLHGPSTIKAGWLVSERTDRQRAVLSDSSRSSGYSFHFTLVALGVFLPNKKVLDALVST